MFHFEIFAILFAAFINIVRGFSLTAKVKRTDQILVGMEPVITKIV